MTVHIVDPGGVFVRGHHLPLDRLLVDAAEARGHAARVYWHRDVRRDALALLDGTPAFSVSPYRFLHEHDRDPVAPLDVAGRHGRRFRDELAEHVTPALAPGDTVVVHTITTALLPGLLLWFREGGVAGVTLRLVLRYAADGFTTGATAGMAAAVARYAFEALAPADGLHLFADTPALAGHYETLSGRAVAVLPPPVAFVDDAGTAAAPTAPPVVGYLGGTRPDKGADILPDGLARLVERRPDVEVLAHMPGLRGDPPWPDTVLARTRLVRDPLDPAAFQRLMGGASLILLPYAPDAFAWRTSHILAEALGNARPVVTTPGTWMADELVRYGPVPGAVMADYSGGALADAAAGLLDTLPAALDAAARAAPHARERHDGDRIAARLVGVDG